MVFDLVAARKGAHWSLVPQEKDAIGRAVDSVLAKYIPTSAEAYGPEIGLAVAAMAIVVPRMQKQDDAQADGKA